MTEDARRSTDQGIVAVVAKTTQATSQSFWVWAEHHHVDSLAVLVATLWLTVRVVDWAFNFSYDVETKMSGTDKAAIIAALMTPWALMQGAMVKWYMELKAKKNGIPSP